jgi:hypothetical protein
MAATMCGMTQTSLPPGLAARAAAQGGPFSTQQARSAGFEAREIYRRLKSGQWTRLRRGIYIETFLIPDDEIGRHLLRLRAVVLSLGPQAAASHVTGATLLQLALLDPDRSLIHITRDSPSRIEAGIHHHEAELPPGHLTKIDDILTTTAGRTVVDLSRALPFEAGLVAAESALNKGLTTLTELREILAYCADWPGARDAGRVVSFASPYSESPGESLGRIAFDALGLPQPSQQVWIFDKAGLIARVDYWWEKQRTVGEFDGRLKYDGDNASKDTLYDEKRREDRLREAGAEVFRFDWPEARAKSPSIRQKALAAFDRAARSVVRPTLRAKRQPPAS